MRIFDRRLVIVLTKLAIILQHVLIDLHQEVRVRFEFHALFQLLLLVFYLTLGNCLWIGLHIICCNVNYFLFGFLFQQLDVSLKMIDATTRLHLLEGRLVHD